MIDKKWPKSQLNAPRTTFVSLSQAGNDHPELNDEDVVHYTRTDIAEAHIAELEVERNHFREAAKRAVLAYERLGNAKAPLPRQDDIREIEDSMIALKNLVINHD